MSPSNLKRLLLCLILLTGLNGLLAGCGNKGELYMPEQAEEEQVEEEQKPQSDS